MLNGIKIYKRTTNKNVQAEKRHFVAGWQKLQTNKSKKKFNTTRSIENRKEIFSSCVNDVHNRTTKIY